jgi:hypothetical protein
MNRALQALQDSNPELFLQFMTLLRQDFGLESELSMNGYRCPSCDTPLDIKIEKVEQSKAVHASKVQGKRAWNPKPNSLFNLLVRVARLRKATTGKVSADFNKQMQAKMKGRTAAETKEIKIKWLKDQLAKGRRNVA